MQNQSDNLSGTKTKSSITSNTELIKGPNGDIMLRFSSEPTYDQYEFLEAYINLRKQIIDPERAKKKDKS